MWYEERSNKTKRAVNPAFSICCHDDKVRLSKFHDAPPPLNMLLDYTDPATLNFKDKIKVYNSMFCFTSFGARIDHSINTGERTKARQYNRPTVAEVAALITNDFGHGVPTRDIIVKSKDSETPSQTKDPEGYKVVTEFMLDDPCGKDAKSAPCNIEEKCSKHFPKAFNEETIIDANGYPIYRRRDNKSSAMKGKSKYDNKYVVPHNRYLLLKYQAHINVEWCNQSKAIKYLLNYLNTGPDRATIVIEENVKSEAHVQTKIVTKVDEIKSYLNC
uniref:Uncharacterized protein n=1 Tax=Tanacetum cinerariifolium TaxID=118510 RepID=A0A6L2N2H9_TANCI|nr:uncharacterized protein [Tanacetum cinerariifolium]